jgi:[protein-PII] uridylyltransferase
MPPDTGAAPELLKPPYFDPVGLRRELAVLAEGADGDQERHRVVLERLKGLMHSAREAARAALEDDGNGRLCAAGLSEFQDELIRVLYDHTTRTKYRANNPSDAERMAIVATGGYGRGLLAPGSDIDLLFLLAYKQTPWSESVAENILYLLWDLGLKVGHATRTVDQCVRLAAADTTIKSALLDMRLVHGDAQLFTNLSERFYREAVRGHERQFIEAKLEEREDRHRRSGASRYRVEPNLKDGKGGLRDLHTLHWLAKAIYGMGLGEDAELNHVFTSSEHATFRRCETFLWSVRCHLHFLTGRPEERLSFDVQPALAERLGYRSRGGLRDVERFMKHYFLIAKEVGDLTTILCSALEIQQLKSTPRLNSLLNPLTWATRRRVRQLTDFRIDNGRINVADPDVFKRDPVNIIRIFSVAEQTGTLFHPSALRLLRNSLRLIDDKLREDKEANRIFLDMLVSPTGAEAVLRHMNEAGVLGRFVPDFGRVVSMMQFNMYHHFTVDEHLIRTVGQMHSIEAGELIESLPVSTSIVKTIQNRRGLYLAAFLHDIAKGRREDHSIVGGRIARVLGPRLGFEAEETELAAWLVEQHLVMSNIAQSRDLSDPKTIRDFANLVQTRERLNLLLLLTVADIRAVGPGTWNGWKGQLLRQLYWETETVLAGGHTQVERRTRINAQRKALAEALSGWPAEEIEKYLTRHYDDYWLKTDTKRQVEHANLVRRAEAAGLDLATDFTTDAFTAITELTVLAPNHPRLLSLFAGCCAVCGANIVGAHIATTRDGRALDTFLLQREFELDDDESRRTGRITATIESVLRGDVRLSQLMARRKPMERRITAFTVEPEVSINNQLSDVFTVIEVQGIDRPGLLYELTSTLSDLSLDITSAHITTYGEKAVDVFYVTDLTGKKIDSEVRQQTIAERLRPILAGKPHATPTAEPRRPVASSSGR